VNGACAHRNHRMWVASFPEYCYYHKSSQKLAKAYLSLTIAILEIYILTKL
jgi:hypothetical protein